MKLYKYSNLILLVISLALLSCNSQSNQQQNSAEQKSVANESTKITAEVACGECQFGLHGESCDLAVKIDGKAYFVDGLGIDDLGDAHAEDGLCNTIRKGNVEGYLKEDRFIAQNITLLPLE